ncbi:TonB-dependent receptor [Puteibacter caeruleilacunae]|nr:TonB-dependent receptor [Puteibacter caeruleilacunae]
MNLIVDMTLPTSVIYLIKLMVDMTKKFNTLRMILSLFFMTFLSLGVSAQSKITATGNVTSDASEPIIGATIVVKGTTQGIVTDINGDFTLPDVTAGAILQVSFIGYQTAEVPASAKMKIILKQDVMEVEEVQVIAYGVQKKATVTGAISSVDTEDLLKTPSSNVMNTLAGAMPGLMTVQRSGQPGSEDPRIFIRGAGSLNDGNSSPLILVDGVERSFSQLDPNEIADLTILKDASATAVFGVRGANGVILVTTKRGSKGKAAISVSSSFGLQQPTRIIKMADSYTFASTMNQINEDDGEAPSFTEEAIEAFKTNSNPILFPNVDWEDYVIRDFAVKTQHNMNISGGNNKMRYYVSLGYLFQDGVIKDFHQDYNNNFNYNRYNYRVNLDINLTKSTEYKIGIGGWFAKQHEPKGNGNAQSIWGDLLQSKPFASPGIIDGYVVKANNDIIQSPTPYLKHPLETLYGVGYYDSYKNTLNLDMEIKQDLSKWMKGLEFSVKGAFNTRSGYKKERYKSSEVLIPIEKGAAQGKSKDDPDYDTTVVYKVSGTNTDFKYNESGVSHGRDWYLESKLFWKNTFGDHALSGLALYNMSRRYYPGAPRHIPRSYLGLVGRATYSYKSRYMFDINVGYNGSENFAKGSTRYGLFPAFSAGWIISEENFMANQSFVEYLKLRGSYGIVGSDKGASRFMYIDGVWNPGSGSYDFSENPNKLPAAMEGKLGNPEVTWETATKQNYGLDMRLFNSKFALNADYFIENRKDILITRQTLPSEFAINLPNINMGRVRNQGYELNATWRAGDPERFSYFINANMTYAKNKILEKDEIKPKNDYQYATGGPTGRTLVYAFDRFYEEGDFVDGELKEGLPVPTGKPLVGDPMYKDLNNDGLINDYDRHWSKYGQRPEYVFGVNFGFTVKGFDFSTQWTGVTHVSRYLQRDFRAPFGGNGGQSLAQYAVDEAWTPERGQSARFPRMTITREKNSYADSDLYMWDASYIRLKNVQASYTFSDSPLLSRLGIKKLKVYVNGLNLLTFDHIKYFDPEAGTSNVDHENDIRYPMMRMYNMGVNINF